MRGSVESEVSVARAESSGTNNQRRIIQPLVLRATSVRPKRVRVLHVEPLLCSVMWQPQEGTPRRLGNAGKRLDLDARLVVERTKVAIGAGVDFTQQNSSQCRLDDEGITLLTNTLSAGATNVPRASDGRAVLAGTGGRATAARLELVLSVETLPVVGQTREASDRASLETGRAKRDVASLVAALPTGVAALARAARVARVSGVSGVARLARRRGGNLGRGAMREAALRAVVPAPAGATLRGWLVGVVGNAALLAGVPVPVRGAVAATRGLGRVGIATMRQAAALIVPPVRTRRLSRAASTGKDMITYHHSLEPQLLDEEGVGAL